MNKKTFKKGIIIVDIILALAMGTIFISLILSMSFETRNIFERAKTKKILLDKFESSTSTKYVTTKLFGNDMHEKNVEVRFDDDLIVASSSKQSIQSISFTSVVSLHPENNLYSVGTPYCPINYFRKSLVGLLDYGTVKYRNMTIEPVILPTDPLLPLTDIQVRNGIAYISADSAKSSDPDIFIVDINDKNDVKILSSLDTGPGLSALAVAGRRVYGASASTAYQLHTINMNNLSSLSLENRFALALPYATATRPFASSIFYRNGYVYLGTEKWDDQEFSIIDVHDPTVPYKVGGFETGSKINDILINNSFAYLADSDELQLRILNIENPAYPILFDSFSSSGFNRQEGKAISRFEDIISFGRTSGGFDIVKDHELFSFASTSSTTLAEFKSINISGGVYGSIIGRDFLYTITRQLDKEFQIFNNSDLSSIEFENGTTTVTGSYSLPVAPEAITCDGDNLYILAHLSPVIYHVYFH